ncbi:hypothetical protein [uncultured Microbulbifer sp.]|uniref:hypothetical protein n=1 Tax=uncultured Microbulbifer sp. TaxID=348147 RepID=UPI0026038DF5|nr:hypothetical protein [uncultured Microbulbifer sp.]
MSPIANGGGITDLNSLYLYVVDPLGADWTRSVSRLSFLINDQYWPASPENFKQTNIAIHLLTGLLLFWVLLKLLSLKFTEREAGLIALLATAIWMLHPYHVSTTLYVVQRMTQLMTLFLILSLFLYISFRLENSPLKACCYLTGSVLAATLSVFSKENGAIILLLVPLIEYSFVQRYKKFYNPYLNIALLFGVVIFFMIFSLATRNSWSSWDDRVFFSVLDRLSIQGEVIAEYWGSFFFIGSADWGLYHDDKEWLYNLNGIQFTSLWWLFHIGIAAFAFYLRKKAPLVTFSVCWFYLTHIIESTVVPMELKYEHRNYLPYIGLATGFSYLLVLAGNHLKKQHGRKALVVMVLPLAVSVLLLSNRAETWSDYRYLAIKWSERHPYSLRAQLSIISLLAETGNPQKALDRIEFILPRFSDPSLELLRLNIQCEYPGLDNVRPIYSSNFREQHYSIAVDLQLREILTPEKLACVNYYLPEGGMTQLLQDIEQISALNRSPRLYVSYLDLSARAYLLLGKEKQALIARENAWKLLPNIVTGLELAKIYLLTGDKESASKLIDWIDKQNKMSVVHDRVIESNLSALKSTIYHSSN